MYAVCTAEHVFWGGPLWAPSKQQYMALLLRTTGARIANYVEVIDVIHDSAGSGAGSPSRAVGVRAKDLITGTEFEASIQLFFFFLLRFQHDPRRCLSLVCMGS